MVRHAEKDAAEITEPRRENQIRTLPFTVRENAVLSRQSLDEYPRGTAGLVRPVYRVTALEPPDFSRSVQDRLFFRFGERQMTDKSYHTSLPFVIVFGRPEVARAVLRQRSNEPSGRARASLTAVHDLDQ